MYVSLGAYTTVFCLGGESQGDGVRERREKEREKRRERGRKRRKGNLLHHLWVG